MSDHPRRIECFLLTETEFIKRSLRRFAFTSQRLCAAIAAGTNPYGCCNAETVIEPRVHKPRQPDGLETLGPDVPRDDPRWPASCVYCGETFLPEHHWQVNDDRLYENAERGVVTTLTAAPVGALWWAHWCQRSGSIHWKARGGGPHLLVRTPGGDWDVDMASSNGDGEGWERTGEPPKVTVRPSIGICDKQGGWKYHGFLTDGVLEEC